MDHYEPAYQEAIAKIVAIGVKITKQLAEAQARLATPARERLPLELRPQSDQLAELTEAFTRG